MNADYLISQNSDFTSFVLLVPLRFMSCVISMKLQDSSLQLSINISNSSSLSTREEETGKVHEEINIQCSLTYSDEPTLHFTWNQDSPIL